MKLNWFSPLLPERTDIAHYTARLAPVLLQHFDVTFWTDLTFDARCLPPGADVQEFDARTIDGRVFYSQLFAKLNVYNFGNDARFHAGIFHVASKVPGLAVLHDTRLHHFFFELFRHGASPWTGYVELAAKLYGRRGEVNARQVVADKGRCIDELVEEMPFIEAIADNSIAVICHSKAAYDDIRRRSDAPVLMVPLPYEPLIRAAKVSRVWAPPWRFVLFGYLNPNRRLESILRALGGLRDRIDFRLDVFGTLWDRQVVETIVAREGLSSRVELHGFVSEQTLDEAIGSAHLSFNLRYPTMGEASGGILRSWAHATPALVTDAGWYSDLPETVAWKLPVANEIAHVQESVSKLDAEPARFEAMGMAARRWLGESHSSDGYVEALGDALVDLPRLWTRRAGRKMLQQVAEEARSRAERRVLLDRAARTASRLFSVG